MKPQAEELRARLGRFLQFFGKDPANIKLALDIAQLQFQLGEFANAKKTLTDALILAPGHAGLIGTQASIAMAEGHPDEAIAILEGLLRSGHDAPALRYNLAYAYSYSKRFAEARDLLRPLCDDPKTPGAMLLLARALHHLGDIEGAIACAQTFLASNNSSADAYGLLSMLHLDAQRAADAQKAAERALALDPDDVSAHITLGSIALGEQNDLAAHEHYTQAVRHQPTNGRAWSGMGLAAMMRSDLLGAIDQLRKAVHFMPDHIGTWHALAWCQLMTEDVAGARRSFDVSLALNRNFSETHGGLAVIAFVQGRIEDAEHLAKLALRLDPTSFSGRYAQSLLLQKSDPRRSKEMIRQILDESVTPNGESLGELARRTLQRLRNEAKGKHTLH